MEAVGGPYLGDDDAAVAAAIGASLDMLDISHPDKKANNINQRKGDREEGDGVTRGGGVGDGAGVGGGGGSGGGGVVSTPPPRPGSNASQDLAFLTDAPLLPPAGAARRGDPADTDGASGAAGAHAGARERGRSGGSRGVRELADGTAVFGEGGLCVGREGWGRGGGEGRTQFFARLSRF